MKEKRKKVWIDRFQTYLFLRIALYFICYQALAWGFIVLEHHIFVTCESLFGGGPAAYCIIFLPVTVVFVSGLFIWDGIKLAHRIVGPVYRFRQTVKAIAAGEEVQLIVLRKGDFLQDMKGDFNEMLKVLEQRGAVVIKRPGEARDKSQPLPV